MLTRPDQYDDEDENYKNYDVDHGFVDDDDFDNNERLTVQSMIDWHPVAELHSKERCSDASSFEALILRWFKALVRSCLDAAML